MKEYKMKILWLLKVIIAGIIALMILSLFVVFYKYTGAHENNPSGVTDYKWEPNQWISAMDEGFNWFRMDENGFNNAFPADAKGENVDLLLMGDSHMQSAQVDVRENVGYRLNQMLPDIYTYNIGIQKHFIYSNVKNLRAALTDYEPSKYVVIETDTVELNEKEIAQVLDGTYAEFKSYDSGLIYIVQKSIPAAKRLYQCLENWWEADHPAGIQKPEDYSSASYITLLDRFLGIVGQAAKEHGVTPIIFYMPQTQIDRQGSYVDPTDEEAREAFAAACERNGICFVDMGGSFRELYESDHILAHGFINTGVGQAHINKYGHEAVAATLADVIGRMEDAREAEQ